MWKESLGLRSDRNPGRPATCVRRCNRRRQRKLWDNAPAESTAPVGTAFARCGRNPWACDQIGIQAGLQRASAVVTGDDNGNFGITRQRKVRRLLELLSHDVEGILGLAIVRRQAE